jgi:hypothetical protein
MDVISLHDVWDTGKNMLSINMMLSDNYHIIL